MAHISVLMKEVIEGLDIKPHDIVVDGTINGGGHSCEIAKHLTKDGVLVGIDQDSSGLALSQEVLKHVVPRVHLIHDNTKNIENIITSLGFTHIDKLLLDLGWSSNQFENPERGFSFIHNGPLRMSLSDDASKNIFTAEDIVNDWEESSLIDIFEGYGEERYAWHIVQAILKAREEKRITQTIELAEIISNAVPLKYRNGPTHPATKTFQALRIAVNDEMMVLREILEKSFPLLNSGGRMVVISFHSIEDRIVKNYFKQKKDMGVATLVTKKPIIATQEELTLNKRARSAKLRILEKI